MAIFQGSGEKNNKSILDGVTGKSVMRYTMMPEILPRIRALGMHFGHFAYLLALIFSSARLIPVTHPSLNAANIGRFGVRQVIAIAANNITWSRKNVDQIAIFSAIVIGMIMIAIQAGLIAVAALVGFDNPASAQSFFASPNPATDPMMRFFSMVFGDLGDFWGIGAEINGNGANRIHDGIRAMLSLYSSAMMIIAVIIVLYYIMTVVGEAAKTGTPFGQRFNSLWAPIRLVVALGLLVPLSSGLNSAQYLTLTIAKMGSGLGSQVWLRMIEAMEGEDGSRYILDDFETPWLRETAVQVFILEVCKHANNKYYGRSADINPSFEPEMGGQIREITQENLGTRTYRVHYQTSGYTNNGISEAVLETFPEHPSTIGAYCGSININFSSIDSGSLTYNAESVPVDEIYALGRGAIQSLVENPEIDRIAREYAYYHISPHGGSIGSRNDLNTTLNEVMAIADILNTQLLEDAGEIQTEYTADLTEMLEERSDSWVYAGVWYLEIGRMIQAAQDLETNAVPNTTGVGTRDELLRAGVFANPFAGSGIDGQEVTPLILNIREYYAGNAGNYTAPIAEPTQSIRMCDGLKDRVLAVGVNANESWLEKAGCLIVSLVVPEDLVVLARINDGTREGNPNLDPMASLISAGYAITQKSWSYILMGLGANGVGAILSAFGPVGTIIGSFANAMGSVMILLGTIGFAAGLILYLLLPVFPLIYFFFAVVSWVMEIFEAVVAMPLWALSFLQISGDGFPGPTAMNGFYLLLAILLRPALIVIGLIAGSVIFGGSIYLLQELFYRAIIIKNAGSTTGIETLLYVIVFTYIAYSAALTSFKLVDQIPNQVLRWIGSGTPTFSDGKEDPVGNNNQLAFAAAGIMGGQAASTIGQAGGGIKQGFSSHRQQKMQEAGDKVSGQRHSEMVDAMKSGGQHSPQSNPSGNQSNNGGNGQP